MGLFLGPYDGPRGGVVSDERGTPVGFWRMVARTTRLAPSKRTLPVHTTGKERESWASRDSPFAHNESFPGDACHDSPVVISLSEFA